MTGLDDAALHFLGGLAHEAEYRAGEAIVREGEPGDRLFFVVHGRVTVSKSGDAGQPVVLGEFGPGDFFGEMSLVESVVRSASVVAAEPTRVYSLKAIDFYRLYKLRPEQYAIVMLNIARDLSRRLRQLDEQFCHRAH